MSITIPQELLLRVQRPARYTGGEPGQVVKDPDAVDVRFGLCFPDAYEIGMSHLGLRILYSRLNQHPRIWCERAFSPMPDMERQLREHRIPLTTLESRTPLKELDVLGFSLQHELCHTNLLQMLDLAGLPLRAGDRDRRAPLVLVGGPAASNPEPIAPFVDAVALGDGEETAVEAALIWSEARLSGATRAEALAELARHPAIYVPGPEPAAGPEPLARAARITDLDAYPFPTGGPVALTEAVFDRAMVEIARGCSGGCRFCQAGMIYRPVRERSPGAILDCLLGQIERGGYDEASLTSLSTADYSQIGPLVRTVAEQLGERDVALSVSSLRAHGLAPELTEALARVRTTSLTLAPEAGSQRLRDVINKNATEAEILRGARAAITRSRRRIKLYFMVGLPTETDDDVRAIAELARKIQTAVAGRSRRRAAITVSVSTFVPKPHTPLQWCAAIGPEEVRGKHELLRSLLRPARIELRTHDVRLSMLEALLSRADRRAADLIEAAYRAGARFDSWDDHFDERAWQQAVASWHIDPADMRREIPLDAALPWDHLEMGPTKSFLKREYRRALKGRTTPICLRPDGEGSFVCNHCGVECDVRASTLSEAPVAEGNTEAQAFMRRSQPSRPRDRTEQVRLRLVFAKTGPLVMLGHLDTVRMLSRLVRRSGLTVAYSRGFHPKPKISLGAPLTLGLAGLSEVVDLTLEDPPSPDELLRRLRDLAPEGLRPRSIRRLGDSEPGAARSVLGAELLVPSDQLPSERSELTNLMSAILDRTELIVERPKKGSIDLRPSLLCLELWDDTKQLDELNITAPAISARVALNRGPSIRPEDLCEWLGIDRERAQVYRVVLLQGDELEPLE